MTRKTKIVFKGTARNGQLIFDHPKLWESQIFELEGKRFDLVIEQESKPKSISQLGYLFGGIIESTCLRSNVFEGWTKDEVLAYLLSKLTSYTKEVIYPDGHRELIVTHDDISGYDKEQLRLFIDQVIIFLSSTHGLVVLSPDEYRYEKYFKNVETQEKEW